MNAPPNAGSIYYNYKKTHSIVLMGICDANYKFIYVDVGSNGRMADGGVFNKCSFAQALNLNALNLPQAEALPERELEVPYVFVADDAFALKPNILKPFPGKDLSPTKRVFNYRLSRARRCIENTFGILSAKFRVMRSPIALDPEKTRKITLACCALHNYLISRKSNIYAPAGTFDQYTADGTRIDGNWRKETPERTMYQLEHVSARYLTEYAKKVREDFSEYFMSSLGEVPWQFKYI